MSDSTTGKSISQLSSADAVSDSDIIPITQAQNGTLVTSGATMAQVLAYVVQALQAAGLVSG